MSQGGLDSGSMMSQAEIDRALVDRFLEIHIPEPALSGGVLETAAAQELIGQLSGGILAEVARFLGEHSDLLPSKTAVLDAVNAAIDALLATAGRPIITRLVGPAVKKLIANAVDAMYDAILNPPVETEPRTEV